MPTLLNHNPDVLSCLASLSNDEVFTPPSVVNQMLDRLPQSLFSDPNSTFLDPATKSGVFLREIAKRLIVGLQPHFPDLQARLNHIYTHQLFGIGITELTSLLSRRSLYCSRTANNVFSQCQDFDDEYGNVFYRAIAHEWVDGKCRHCGASQAVFDRGENRESHAYNFIHNPTALFEKLSSMKFDVIIGNPPYQLSDGGAQASAKPIYHLFVEQAKKLNPDYLIMIIPARWYSGGKGLDEFRAAMLADRDICELHDFPNSSDCFTGVDIKGGVCYFLRKRGHQGDCQVSTYEQGKCVSSLQRPLKEQGLDFFIRDNNAIGILNKVSALKEKSFSELISSRKPFGFPTNFQGYGKSKNNTVRIYVNKTRAYVSRDEIKQNKEWIDRYKVLVPYAIGSGDSKTDLVKPILAEPNSCCSETYLVFGVYDDEQTAKNVISYIKTRFFHFMLTLKKNTQHATKNAYQLVPMQDFSQSWSDEKLYQKYGLTEQEIAFIESMVRPMEVSDE